MKNETTTLRDHVKSSTLAARKRILIAGIGNIFMKDDDFGAAVIKKISSNNSFENVEVSDVGTGGLKIAYDLTRGYDGLILIDASPRGEKPGTLYVIEPGEKEINAELDDGSFIDPHGAD